jgi:dipeptidyl aminopeptidase/acylaminoacyl peptidase
MEESLSATPSRAAGFAVALILAASPAAAQRDGAPVSPRAQFERAEPRPTVTPADYAQWERLGSTELSPDGQWLAWVIERVDADEELRYRRVAHDSVAVVMNGYSPKFSRDGRWLAYSIGVPRAELEQPGGSSSRPQAGIMDLRSGVTVLYDDVAAFDFSADSRYLALRRFPARDAGGGPAGTDLTVRELLSGRDIGFGSVAEHAWRGSGAVLAMIVAAAAPGGNGVQLHDAASGVLRALVTDSAEYRDLVWRDATDDLAVLRIRTDEEYDAPRHDVVAWRAASTARPRMQELSAARLAADHALRIASARRPEWSKDGATLFIGVRDLLPAQAEDTMPAADRPGVEVWHTGDVDIAPARRTEAMVEQSRSMLAAWHVERAAFVPLARSVREDVVRSDGAIALIADPRPWDRDRMYGPIYRDLHVVDYATGARSLVAERVQHHHSISPSGRYVLYVRDGAYWTFDTRTARHVNITAGVSTSFVNLDHDYTVEDKPVFGSGGWLSDDRHVLLYDRYDVWLVAADGTSARNATNGAAERIRHRRIWLTPDHRVLDATRPFYVSLYGETSKQFGYGRVLPGGRHERLVLRDAHVSRLGRAADADVFYYRVESFEQSPNWYVGSGRLGDAVRVTDTNPFQVDFAWGSSTVIDFVTASGRPLQAALHYPANYVPGQRYPMIVQPYEITSAQVHNYVVPSEFGEFNATVFTQNGYFVLRPDIVYRARDPGVSAVEALVPAAQRVVDMGLADPDRIGLAGHSWGAYQAAFTVTQTDAFAAAAASAPLTNMISMYLSVFWNLGMPNARIFEIDQGRMEVPFWHDVEAYIRNSPVFHVERLNTPLLVAFGRDDGAVDFNQGVELYNAARRAGRDMVLLVYEGENHTISRRANQRDLHRRVLAWFGHHLKGGEAADWMER